MAGRSDLLEDLDDSQIEFLQETIKILASLSTVMSLVALLTNYFNAESRKKASLVFSFYFGVSSFFISITFLLGPMVGYEKIREGGPWCVIQGFLVEYFASCCTLWWFLLTFHLWNTIVRGNLDKTEVFAKYYHIIGWGYPGVIAIIMLLLGYYGDSGFWCWIDSANSLKIVGALYGQMMIYWVVGVYMWVAIIHKIRLISRLVRSRNQDGYQNDGQSLFPRFTRHFVFITMFFLVFFALIFSRLQIEYTSGRTEFAYWMTICCIAPTIGIYYSLVFLLTRENYVFWKYMLLSQCNRDLAVAKSHQTSSTESNLVPHQYIAH